MTIVKTKIHNYNETLWSLIVPQSILLFVRASLAHLIAGNGLQWVHIFDKYNDGTYSCQWLVTKYKKSIKRRINQHSGLFIMLEQMP